MNPILYAILVLMLVAVPVLIVFDGRNARKGRAYILAKRIFDRHVKLWETEKFEYRAVSLGDYPNLDTRFYDTTARELIGLGFQTLGDVENTSITEASGLRTCIRVMVDESHSIVAYYFELYSNKLRSRRKLVAFTTEFSDGRLLSTNNSNSAKKPFHPPHLDSHSIPEPISATELLKIHRTRMEEFCSRNPQIGARSFRSIDDVTQGWLRDRALQVAFRKTLTGEQLKQQLEQILSLKKRDPLLVAAVAEEYERLCKSYQGKA